MLSFVLLLLQSLPQQESITTNSTHPFNRPIHSTRPPSPSLQTPIPIVKPNNLSLSSRSLTSINFRKLSELSLTKLSA